MLENKVAVITGAARGQGCSHALRLADAGVDVIAIDLCAAPSTIQSPGATEDDLAETVREVERRGRRAIPLIIDVRDLTALVKGVREAAQDLGTPDIVLANAGIWASAPGDDLSPESRGEIWRETIDINLTGAFNTLEATVPLMIEGGRGGAIVITSSVAGLATSHSSGGPRSVAQVADVAYSTSKHGLVGLMRFYASELGRHGIRVNSVHPTAVDTPMVSNDAIAALFSAAEDPAPFPHALPVDGLQCNDVSDAILYLVSDAGRYITGVTLPVDAGHLVAR